LIFGLAKRLPGWEFIGVEQSPTPWLMSNILSVANNYGNYRFYIADSNVVGLKNYDVIFVDQNASILKKWEVNLARRLEPGTLLFTLNAQLPRVKFREKMTIDDVHTLYLYQKAIPQEESDSVTDKTDKVETAEIPA
jgi:predicted O-methyltransferase YrrM